jgi:hypothetical protein
MSAVSLAKRMPDNIPSFAEAAAKHRSLHNSSGKQPLRQMPASTRREVVIGGGERASPTEWRRPGRPPKS